MPGQLPELRGAVLMDLQPLAGETREQYRERVGAEAVRVRAAMKGSRGRRRAAFEAELAELGAAWDRNRATCATCGATGALLVWRAVFGGATGTAGLMHDSDSGPAAAGCREPKPDAAADAGPAVGPPGAPAAAGPLDAFTGAGA